MKPTTMGIKVRTKFLSRTSWDTYFSETLRSVPGSHYVISNSSIDFNEEGLITNSDSPSHEGISCHLLMVDTEQREYVIHMAVALSIHDALFQNINTHELLSFTFIDIPDDDKNKIMNALETKELNKILDAIEAFRNQ